MRILRLRAYYDPEKTAGIHLDHDLCEAFMKNGIYYISYTPSPTRGVTKEVRDEYRTRKKETLYNGYVEINRFDLFREGHNPIQRALRYAVSTIKEYRLGADSKSIDVVYSSSTPPTQGMLSALVAKRLSKREGHKIPFVFNLQDIFPDSLVNAGMTTKGSLIWRIGRKIEDYTYRHADKIIVISEGFKSNIISKGVPEEKIVVVSNWVDLDEVQPVDRQTNSLFDEFDIDRSKFIVVYAGNLGEAQGADVILDAAKNMAMNDKVQFVLFGGGARFQEIKERVEKEIISNVFITGLQPQERVSEVYSMGDVALITCKPGTGNAGMPSKTWSIMACNTPIIASFDMDSDLADVIRVSGAGCCVEPGDAQALADAIEKAYEAWKHGKKNTADIRGYALKTASKEACVQKYVDTLMNTVKESREN